MYKADVMYKFYTILFWLAVIFSCSKPVKTKQAPFISACMQTQIDSALAKPKGSLFTSIDAYQYNNAVVYLYYAGCCDRFNELKDQNCNYLFSPSGGITGCGDCNHQNFFNEAVLVSTVWTDPRP